MRLKIQPLASDTGSTLATVLVVGGITSISIASMLSLTSASYRMAQNRIDRSSAYYQAENALEWAAQNVIADTDPSDSSFYSTANGTLSLAYMAAERQDASSGFKNAWVKVARTNAVLHDTYLVEASARVGNEVRTLQAVIKKNAPSQIFDYEYFLNNWGWWWGSTITGEGGNRANWDFDFQGSPIVNGEIYASGRITHDDGIPTDPMNGTPPFGGDAGQDPVAYVHAGAPRLDMPNLKDMSYYSAKALADVSANGIWQGGAQLVYGVQTNSAQPGLYLAGTASAPIVVKGTAVVPGDVIISGKMTGQGTLYVGGNLYIAGNLTYANGPWSSSSSTAPETMNPAQRDQWVSDNQGKDLVALAVRGSVLGGDVTSSSWVNWCYSPADYGLKNVGDESQLGADGIAGTPDDGVPYLDTNGDGIPDSAAYDADGDGVIHVGGYNYNTEINMTDTRASLLEDYPVDKYGKRVAYSSVASNNMNSLDGIFYTDHAYAMLLLNANALFHGVVVSRNEAIVYSSTCKFIYDSRVNSRYNKDPNRFIDLGLPVAGVLTIASYAELTPPDATGL